MSGPLSDVAVRLRAIHDELESEVGRRQAHFEQHARAAHRRLKQSLLRFLRESSIPNLLTAPAIYSMIVPLVLMDLWISAYQRICFPIYGIPRVRRRDFLIIDRHRLGYLNGIEKANCVYCGYANGLFAYLREISARTEQYWCPIKHARAIRDPHAHYVSFVDYLDADGYHKRLPVLRRSWRTQTRPRRSRRKSR